MVLLEHPTPVATPSATEVPLVVDLDGTLLRSDSLIESTMALARERPRQLLALPLWGARGPAYLKRRVAQAALPDVETLPYRTELLSYLEAEKRRGRTLVLATDADERLAREIAARIGLFDTVLASDGLTNLRGQRKAERLIETFGERGFDYVGNGRHDLPVWRAARAAVVVSASRWLARRIARTTPVDRVFAPAHARASTYLQALRPFHWIKNALVFVPLATAYPAVTPALIRPAALAFVAFCLCASSVYLLNDLLDLGADRRHPQKKHRKLASGAMPLAHAFVVISALLVGALWVGVQLPRHFLVVLASYLVVMTTYSLGLKHVPVVDVLMLAGGYALRVFAGAVAMALPVSPWLLATCVSLFLSLALIKRYAELALMDALSSTSHARGYVSSDKTLILVQGIASGYLSVALLALYTNSEIDVPMHPRHALFWIVCALLLCWLNVMWLAATRGRMHHDPVVFAATDRLSLGLLIVMAGVALLAL
jgi:4-hydroxybenzoate polyprenyltransferase/phosphoserine phosphatase